MVIREVVQQVEEMVVRKVKEMEDEVEDVDVDVVFLDTLEPIPQLKTVLAALTVFVHRV